MSILEKLIVILLGLMCGYGLGRLWQGGWEGFVIGVFSYFLYVIYWIVLDLSDKKLNENL